MLNWVGLSRQFYVNSRDIDPLVTAVLSSVVTFSNSELKVREMDIATLPLCVQENTPFQV